MKCIPIEEFTQCFPHANQQTVKEVYENPFQQQHIILYFEGWEYDDTFHCFIDNSEERNMIWFNETTYCINGLSFPWPETLNKFIYDCQASHVNLLWSEFAACKIWVFNQGLHSKI